MGEATTRSGSHQLVTHLTESARGVHCEDMIPCSEVIPLPLPPLTLMSWPTMSDEVGSVSGGMRELFKRGISRPAARRDAWWREEGGSWKEGRKHGGNEHVHEFSSCSHVRLFAYRLACSLTRSLTHSLTQALTYTLTNVLAFSLTHLLSHSLLFHNRLSLLTAPRSQFRFRHVIQAISNFLPLPSLPFCSLLIPPSQSPLHPPRLLRSP